MRRRSNLMVLAGIAFFIVGASIVFLVARREESPATASATPNEVDVLVAKETLAQGTLGEDLITQGLVEIKRIPTADRQPTALTAANQLSNTSLSRTFGKGDQITEDGLVIRTLQIQALTIPAGFEAVAVTADFVSGGAGYIAPGDLVNVYTVIGEVEIQTPPGGEVPEPLPYSTPRAELLLTNVRVLDVQAEVAPLRSTTVGVDGSGGTTAPRTEFDTLTLLLAVDTVDAEKVIFSVSHARIYVTRVAGSDAPAAGETDGRDFYTIFDEEPGDANRRSGTAQ